MGVIMAGLSPHPPIIIPEIGGERRSEVRATIESIKELAGEIREEEPDLLITISPHGAVFTDAISIMDMESISGDFGDFGYPEVGFEVSTEPDFVQALKRRAAAAGVEVITLSSREMENYNVPARLDHGVLVPLYFIREAGVAAPLVPITMGLLGYQELYDFGLSIQQTLDDLGLNGVVIASGDLSHRLKPGAPAGFNPRGKEFDEKLVSLLKEERFTEVLELDSSLIEKAGECGLRPVIIMLGALRGLEIRVDIKSYEGPFGVGYAIAGFYPED